MASNRDEIVSADFRKYLLQVFWTRAQKNPQYSFRAFAKDLKTDASSLRKIVRGKRPLGKKVISNLGAKLGLKTDQIENYFLQEKNRQKIASSPLAREVQSNYRFLTVEEAIALCSWVPFAILELMDLPDFRPDCAWIADSLAIAEKEVIESVAKLEQIGWLKRSAGAWEKNVGMTTSDPGDPRIKEARHALITDIARKCAEALQKFPREKRSHSANTMAINSSRLPEALAKIQAFRAELAEFLREGPKDQVYQILVGLYPLSDLKPE